MNQIAQPNKELVLKVLGQVGFEDRLVGYRVGERSGTVRISLYSFQEIVDFLRNSLPQLDFKNLERWIRIVVGDEELGERISSAVEAEENDHDRTQRIRTLMEERLAQCKNAAWMSNLKQRG